MRKIGIALFCFVTIGLRSQIVLNLPTVIQQENQWCWVGCSNSILGYYGFNTSQCQIAEYVRTVATWHNFGSVNCCTNPSASCNYWNYNWGYAGSIEDILLHFGTIIDAPVSNTLSITNIKTEITAGRPYVIHWTWLSGGGHFVVGDGFDASNNVYYMNPWPGEGAKMSTYNWLVSDGVHIWDQTNKLVTTPVASLVREAIWNESEVVVYPNPATQKLFINSPYKISQIELYDMLAKKVFSASNSDVVDLDENHLSKGIYFMKITTGGTSFNRKVVVD